MKWLKTFFDFYINASIHVALSAYALLQITALYFDLPYNESIALTVFFGTITGYNFVKYAGVAKFHHRSLTKNLRAIQLFSLGCFLLLGYYLWQLPKMFWYVLIPLGVLTFLYAMPVFNRFQKNLRSISYLKIVVVALVWTGVTVLLPLYKSYAIYEYSYLLVQRFLFVVVLILPFDIRDVQYDAVALQTIPKRIGVAQTKKLGYILLMICVVLEFVIAPNEVFRKTFFLIFILLTIVLMRTSVTQSKYYSSFWVEAVPIFWWILLRISL